MVTVRKTPLQRRRFLAARWPAAFLAAFSATALQDQKGVLPRRYSVTFRPLPPKGLSADRTAEVSEEEASEEEASADLAAEDKTLLKLLSAHKDLRGLNTVELCKVLF